MVEELKMVVEALNALTEGAVLAFIVWVAAGFLKGVIVGLIVAITAVKIVRTISGAVGRHSQCESFTRTAWKLLGKTSYPDEYTRASDYADLELRLRRALKDD